MTLPATFRAYGLRFHSEIDLPHLQQDEGPTDVRIELGTIDPATQGGKRFRNWEAEPGRFLIDIPSVARLLVTNGDMIRVDPAPGAAPREVVLHIQGSGFAALLQQRRILPMHASSVETTRGALLVSGASGIGKSTTLATLVERGFRMMADDVSGIAFDPGGTPKVIPAFPATRLWEDSVAKLREDAEALDPVREGLAKYYLPVDRFRTDPLALHAVVVLGEHNQPGIAIQPLGVEEKFAWLMQYCFRKKFLIGQQLEAFHFEAVTRMAHAAKVIRVTRTPLPFDPFSLVDRIAEHLDIAPVTAPAMP